MSQAAKSGAVDPAPGRKAGAERGTKAGSVDPELQRRAGAETLKISTEPDPGLVEQANAETAKLSPVDLAKLAAARALRPSPGAPPAGDAAPAALGPSRPEAALTSVVCSTAAEEVSLSVSGEVLGTFIFLLVGLGCVSAFREPALAFASGLLFATALAGPLSGAHLNPAASLAALVAGRLRPQIFAVFVLAQFAGAFAAASLVQAFYAGSSPPPAPAHFAFAYGDGRAIAAEVTGSALLAVATIVLGAGLRERRAEAALAPLVMAVAYAGLSMALAPFSGGLLNPLLDAAPRLTSAVAGTPIPASHAAGDWRLIYLAAPLAGGVIGGVLCRLLRRA